MKKKILIIVIIIVLLIVFLVAGSIIWYNSAISGTEGNDEQIIIEIGEGSTVATVGALLEEKGIIKSELAYKIYIKTNNVNNIIAGKYCFTPSMNLDEITEILTEGKIYKGDEIRFTYIEGKNIRWLATKIAEKTNHTEEEVYALLEDEEYINKMIKKYWFITEEIKNEYIYYTLEGYFYPDTYIFENGDIPVEDIFSIMLNQMANVLDEYKEEIENGSMTVHQILTMASIVELESVQDEDRSGIAGVFYNRLKEGMSLGSDVTTYYAWKIDMGERDLTYEELNTYNPYNTRGPEMQGKIPIGPISSVSKASIEAVINPKETEDLYFVADKNGKVYFSKTYEEHQNTVSALKTQGLWYEY